MKHIFYLFTVVFLVFSCSNDNQDTSIEVNTTQELIDYHSLGNSISDIAQSTLLSNVSENMKIGGPTHTIEYCNLNASRLIDSI